MSFKFEEDEQTETTAIETTNGKFDYSQLDNETAEYLKATVIEFKQDSIAQTTKWGLKFKEIKDKLSNHRNGTFRLWLETFGQNYKTVDNLIS